jgi:D-hydroxyproline dehydrogenase subunit beta
MANAKEPASCDVAIIGGGIVGTSAALFMARAGASVVLLERGPLAAGASGRNSGAIQHPLGRLPAELHRRTVSIYRELLDGDDIDLAGRPAGALILSPDVEGLLRVRAQIRREAPELESSFIAEGETQKLEPALATGLAAISLATGYPVAPSAATLGFARRAKAAGAVILTDSPARPVIENDRVIAAELESGRRVRCKQLLLAAGPWTPELVEAWRAVPPIRPVWGVVVALRLVQPPRHLLFELGIAEQETMTSTQFSLVTAGGHSGLGSVFLEDEPDAASVVPQLLRRGKTFVPGVATAPMAGVRTCARPVAYDGQPLVGEIPGTSGLFVCAGHGPLGISTGPATAEMVAGLMLHGSSAPLEALPELSPLRYT